MVLKTRSGNIIIPAPQCLIEAQRKRAEEQIKKNWLMRDNLGFMYKDISDIISKYSGKNCEMNYQLDDDKFWHNIKTNPMIKVCAKTPDILDIDYFTLIGWEHQWKIKAGEKGIIYTPLPNDEGYNFSKDISANLKEVENCAKDLSEIAGKYYKFVGKYNKLTSKFDYKIEKLINSPF